MKALLDTNILLDVILDRPGFEPESGAVWTACDAGRLTGFVSAVSLTTIYYVVEKTRGHEVAIAAVDECLAAFEVAPVDRHTLQAARGSNGVDFEDDVQAASALAVGVDCIITRDSSGFVRGPLPVYAPGPFMALLASL
jgi:predicted nucleic acid-binding protein